MSCDPVPRKRLLVPVSDLDAEGPPAVRLTLDGGPAVEAVFGDEWHEATKLTRRLTLQALHDAWRYVGIAHANPRQLPYDLAAHAFDVAFAAAPHRDVGPTPRLTDLVLEDVTLPAERRPENVRMDLHPTVVHERVVQSAFDVVDPPVRGATRTQLVKERHLIRELVADEREERVHEVRQIDLGRPSSWP